jgi:hypothetical protein
MLSRRSDVRRYSGGRSESRDSRRPTECSLCNRLGFNVAPILDRVGDRYVSIVRCRDRVACAEAARSLRLAI